MSDFVADHEVFKHHLTVAGLEDKMNTNRVRQRLVHNDWVR